MLTLGVYHAENSEDVVAAALTALETGTTSLITPVLLPRPSPSLAPTQSLNSRTETRGWLLNAPVVVIYITAILFSRDYLFPQKGNRDYVVVIITFPQNLARRVGSGR